MDFDYVKYHKLINNMVSAMNNLKDPDIFKKIQQNTIPVMELFGIAEVKAEYYERSKQPGFNPDEFGMPPYITICEPNYDSGFRVHKDVSEFAYVDFCIYPSKNIVEWDEEDKANIRGFIDLYFHLIARVRLLSMFESRLFHDQSMPFVGTLASLNRDLSYIRNDADLGDYTLYRINISKFSRFNRIFGRQTGDLILNKYIGALKSVSTSKGKVYRLGGDNFIGLIPNEVIQVIQHFFEGYTFKISEDLPEIEIQSKVGFYQIASNSDSNDLIIRRTSATFFKCTEKKKIRFFNIEEERMEEKQTQTENDFNKAMKNGDIVPYFQPKVDANTNKIFSCEALCRWNKDGEIISPFYFIPILEKNNQICRLDFYMLERVCNNLRNWINQGHTPVPVSINFSRNNLADKNFANKVIDTIAQYNIPFNLITVELTETAMETSFDEIAEIVSYLRDNGVLVAVDDFGMGYSSLSLIREIEWDVLKIDKSFVPDKNKPNYDKNLAMLRSVIHLANDIGMHTVVEGVETLEQLTMVKDCGCKIIQGYYFDKPLPADVFEAKLLGEYEGESRWQA